MKRSIIMLLVLIFILCTAGIAMAATNNSPYLDVPRDNWTYSAIQQLAKAGIINTEYSEFKGERVSTRYELAGIVANAMTKYDKADAQGKKLIDKLAAEFDSELKWLSVSPKRDSLETRVNKIEGKMSNVPRFYGNFMQYYDYAKTDGRPSQNKLYTDMRFGMVGNIGDEWKYQVKYIMIGNASANISYRDTISPDPQLQLLNVVNDNFYGGRLLIGKYWIGFTSNMENSVYPDSVRGIGYKKKVGDVTLGLNYGMLDWRPITVSTTDGSYTTVPGAIQPKVTKISADGKIGKTFVGVAGWKFDGYVQGSSPIFTKLSELQIKQPISKDLLLKYNYGKTDAKTQNSFYSVKMQYKDIDLKKVGSNRSTVEYHNIGNKSLIDAEVAEIYTDATSTRGINAGNGLKGFGFTYSFVPYKNVEWKMVIYPNNESVAGTTAKTTTFRTKMDFSF